MDLRSYTKQELALLYFPDSDPDVARAHLMRWIVRCTQLYEQLQKSGYNKNTKEFNPLQVSYIFFHLGEPWYLSVKIGEYRWATMSIGELGKWNVVSLHCDSEREVAHGSHGSHGSSSLQAMVLTIPHRKKLRRSLKSVRFVRSVWENKKLREESKSVRSVRSVWEIKNSVRSQRFVRFVRFVFKKSGTAQRPLNI